MSEKKIRLLLNRSVHVGSCDFPARDLAEVEQNYTNYVELLTTVTTHCPHAKLIISSVLPRHGKMAATINEQIADLNTRLARLAEEDNIVFIDNDIHFKDHAGVIGQLYKAKDRSGVHINDAGKMRLGSSILDALKSTLSTV